MPPARLARILAGISDEDYTLIRDLETNDDDCRSIQTVVTRLIGAGYGYAGMLRGRGASHTPDAGTRRSTEPMQRPS
jgi:hypothetical protein